MGVNPSTIALTTYYEGTNSLEIRYLIPQKSSASHSSSSRAELLASLTLCAEVITGSILYRSYAISYSSCQVMSSRIFSCPENNI